MTYRIHYVLPDGSEDSIDLEGESIEEIRALADEHLAARGAKKPWSEEIT